jgi:hypothetical protein
MPVESATYISELSASNPSGSAPKSEGDNHIRLIKSVLQSTFPAISGAVSASHVELNYVDGVTSAIQTQLDAKAPINNVAHTGTFTATACSSFTIPTASSAASSQEAVNAFWVLDKIASAGQIAGITSLSAAANSVPLANGSGRIDYNWIAGMSSADLRGLLSDETGTGSAVFATSPTLVTPTLGVAAATSITLGGGTALANYLQGTWTPLIGGSTSESGQTYAVQTGTYTRIGNRFFVSATVQLSTAGTITGTYVYFKGFPAAPSTTSGLIASVSLTPNGTLAESWIDIPRAYHATSTSFYGFGRKAATAATTQDLLTPSGIGNSTSFLISGNYNV